MCWAQTIPFREARAETEDRWNHWTKKGGKKSKNTCFECIIEGPQIHLFNAQFWGGWSAHMIPKPEPQKTNQESWLIQHTLPSLFMFQKEPWKAGNKRDTLFPFPWFLLNPVPHRHWNPYSLHTVMFTSTFSEQPLTRLISKTLTWKHYPANKQRCWFQ